MGPPQRLKSLAPKATPSSASLPKSDSKNTGFVVDVSEESPFDPDGAIIGGSNRTAAVVAKKPGCYKYSVGACVSGAVSGMCANSSGEVIIK